MKNLRKKWRRFEVRVQKSARVQGILQALYASYIDFVYRTTRWERIGFESFEADIARGVPRVLCCWHARLSLITYLRVWDDHKLTVLASHHADAELIFKNLAKRDVGIIQVSTSGDNSSPVRDSVRVLRRGESLGVTVDGPMGPALVAKPGALVIAGLAGIQATPCAFAVSRSFRLKTWDNFIVPLPWSRGVLAIGDGFTPPKRQSEENLQAAAQRIERLINDLTAFCEERVGKSGPTQSR